MGQITGKGDKYDNLPIIGVWGNLTYTPIRDEVVMVVTGFGIEIETKELQTAAKERGLIRSASTACFQYQLI